VPFSVKCLGSRLEPSVRSELVLHVSWVLRDALVATNSDIEMTMMVIGR
jgi:hypothetical protein